MVKIVKLDLDGYQQALVLSAIRKRLDVLEKIQRDMEEVSGTDAGFEKSIREYRTIIKALGGNVRDKT